MLRRLAAALVAVAAARAATYRIDCADTLDTVNARDYRPGDRVLFKAGCVWQGQLAPHSSGSDGAPIVFGRYGHGPLPRIEGGGKVEDAVRLYNVQHIEVRDLEVTNRGETAGVRRGVHVFLDNFGTAKHIVISGLYIHDVNGANQRKDNGGITFRTNGNTTPSRFDGLTIERNIIWKVDRSAIAAQSYHAPRTRWFPSLHVVIRDNFVEDIGGDGIVPWATDGVLVEHNIARNCNRRAQSYNAGIWPWSADNSVFQLNEAAFTRTTLDGQGFDSDYNSRNTLFQYNYSHDNEGGFLLICSPVRRNVAENIGNTGTVVRHNISRNDRSRIFHLSGAEQTTVAGNAIYVGKGLDVQMLLVTEWNGWPTGLALRDNLLYIDGTASYGHGLKRSEDGTYTMAPGWGEAKDIVVDGNREFGPRDPRPAIDWNAPQFDPAKPGRFDAFLKRHRAWMLRTFERQFGTPVKLRAL